jgi:predicted Zn-dependent peptidase
MQIPLETHRLSNGLLVTIAEDHTAPVVAVNLWYHVGSANEPAGRTGFAHLFEHMLFQGSANVAANEHFELVQRAGGTLNGSTWLDRTNYFETVPSNQLELALWLEADRMGALLPAMTQQKLDTQRDVVQNERRWSVDNQPYGTWWEKLPALAFPPEHPFHHSLIGSMEDLNAASLDDVARFFRTFYVPDNAVLTVTGDVDAVETLTMISKHFGPIQRGGERPALPSMDVPSVFGTPRREVVADNVMVPRLFLAFRSPVFASDAYYAASVCGAILGLKRGSLLHRKLVRENETASTANAFTFDLAKGSDLLIVDVTARPGISPDALEEAVTQQIDDLLARGVGDDQVTRAQALIESDHLASLQAASTRADQLSRFATYFGEPELLNAQVDRYRAVTAAEVNAFVRERLVAENRASLLYVPAPTSAPEN